MRTPSSLAVTSGPSPVRVLVCDKEGDVTPVAGELRSLGCSVAVEPSASLALASLRRSRQDLAICAIGVRPRPSLEIVSALLATAPDLEVVVVAREAGFGSAVDAMRRGAHDYVTLPLRRGYLRGLVDEHLARRRRKAASGDLAGDSPRPEPDVGGPFTLREIEEEHVKRVLAWTSSIVEAASVLNVHPSTLRRRVIRQAGRAGA